MPASSHPPGRAGPTSLLEATGLSNPEIAAQIIVSAKTVATHLTHIYRKVPCSDRRELRRLARERAQTVPDAG